MKAPHFLTLSAALWLAGLLHAQSPENSLVEPVSAPSSDLQTDNPPAQSPLTEVIPPSVPSETPPTTPSAPPAGQAPTTPAPAPASAPASPGAFGPLQQQQQEMQKSAEGFIIKDANLNDIFQYLAKSAGRQYFHNAKIAGPEYLVTGHLNEGNPLQQMEELAFMYGLNLHTKGNTIYALTAAQLAQLPSAEFHYQLRYLRPTDIEAIKELIKPMLSPGTGIVNFEPKTNTIIIIDSAHRIAQARELLHGIDQVKGQIIVETKILRVNSGAAERVGLDWSATLGEGGTNMSAIASLNSIFGLDSPIVVTKNNQTRNQGNSLTTNGIMNNNSSQNDSLMSNNHVTNTDSVITSVAETIASSAVTSALGITDESRSEGLNESGNTYSRTSTQESGPNLVLSPFQVSAVLRALSEGGIARQLSNPTLITEDNEQAAISIIDRVPIITSTTTPGSGGSPTITTEEIRYKIDQSDKSIDTDPEKHREIGISLVVTPTLLPDGTVRMRMRPRSAQITGQIVSTQTKNVYPRVTESMVESIARIPDGYSLIVGGFYGETDKKDGNKVPLLGDIPVLNFFFKSKESAKEKASLVFVVTPKSYNPTSVSDTRSAHDQLRRATELNSDHNWVDPDNPGPAHEPNLARTIRGMIPKQAPLYPEPVDAFIPADLKNKPRFAKGARR